jgi:hypothetical protein
MSFNQHSFWERESTAKALESFNKGAMPPRIPSPVSTTSDGSKSDDWAHRILNIINDLETDGNIELAVQDLDIIYDEMIS